MNESKKSGETAVSFDLLGAMAELDNKFGRVAKPPANSGDSAEKIEDREQVFLQLPQQETSGYGLPAWYKVIMKGGELKQLSEVQVGDEVLFDGEGYAVSAVVPQGVQSLRSIVAMLATTQGDVGFMNTTSKQRWLSAPLSDDGSLSWQNPTNLQPKGDDLESVTLGILVSNVASEMDYRLAPVITVTEFDSNSETIWIDVEDIHAFYAVNPACDNLTAVACSKRDR
jgi:hypothetical protein